MNDTETKPTILITGASSGIGKGISLKYAKEEKANLVITARNVEKLNELKTELESLGSKVLVVQTDVTKSEDLKNCVAKTIETFGRIDVLINNAGMGYTANIWELTDDQINQMIDTDIKGTILMAKYVSEVMVKQKSGHIVNMSSVAGYFGTPKWSVYSAAKYAVRGFSRAIRYELQEYGVSVTSIHPGPIQTEFFDRGKIEINQKTLMPLDEFINEMYKAIKKKKVRAIIPFSFAVMQFIMRIFPFTKDWIIGAMRKTYLNQ
ncbi:MAG: SDR family oxidoreductase [bacterium]